MNDRRAIARKAMAAALRIRLDLGYGLEKAVCAYDLAEKLGVEVRFLDLPSMEGFYTSGSDPTIVVSSLRPPSRRAFTCAHELGHHNSGDGVHVDEIVEDWNQPRFDRKEFAADCFAGALLMPKVAVSQAFAARGWSMERCTPAQIYMISGYFGVGYATLVQHLRSALRVLTEARARALLKVSPRKAQSLLLGWQTSEIVKVLDAYWTGIAVDVEVGDLLFVRSGARAEGKCIKLSSDVEGGRVFEAIGPGIGRLEAGVTWSAFVRVSRRNYVGRALYRHWEEAGDG